MKKVIFSLTIVVLAFTACDVLQQVVQDPSIINSNQFINDNLWQRFNQKSPISTSFDDATYEAEFLHDFEPEQIEYRPLDIQPKASSGGYILRSGVYSMNAKSFCLRGYTHGPSRGDGHLYAPLKGKKADFIQSIIERYGEKPEIPQQNVQVLLWAIIAGADMNTLGEQHSKTLNELFTMQELLEFQGKDWLNGIADEQINEFKNWAYNNTSPKLRNLLEADDKIRTMVQQNKSFRDIERVAIIAGAAPREDMIREVSKGRWSYHPDGFFVRFFPNGYSQTRIDVYVPFEGDLSFDAAGKPRLVKNDSPQVKEVVFNPAESVAVPANQSSQKIGSSENPVTPTPLPPEEEGKRIIPFHIPQLAYLPIEGAGVHGSFVIRGYAILEEKNGEEVLTVIVNGKSTASNFGQLNFSGDVKLIVNDITVQTSPIVRASNQTVVVEQFYIGDVIFPLGVFNNKSISIEVDAGYIVNLKGGGVATPIPNRANEIIKIK